jgi:hypothetical protein
LHAKLNAALHLPDLMQYLFKLPLHLLWQSTTKAALSKGGEFSK